MPAKSYLPELNDATLALIAKNMNRAEEAGEFEVWIGPVLMLG